MTNSMRVWRVVRQLVKWSAVFFAGWMTAFGTAIYANKGGMRVKGTDQVPLPEVLRTGARGMRTEPCDGLDSGAGVWDV